MRQYAKVCVCLFFHISVSSLIFCQFEHQEKQKIVNMLGQQTKSYSHHQNNTQLVLLMQKRCLTKNIFPYCDCQNKNHQIQMAQPQKNAKNKKTTTFKDILPTYKLQHETLCKRGQSSLSGQHWCVFFEYFFPPFRQLLYKCVACNMKYFLYGIFFFTFQ